MKLAVIVATRGRPEQAESVLGVARMMASGEWPIDYIVAVDDDDQAYDFYDWIVVDHGPRPLGPGGVWNRAASRSDAELIVALPDDSVIGTPRWDEVIARALEGVDPRLAVLGWRSTSSPNQVVDVIAHRQWIDLVGWLYDPRFPFWFSDTAVNETYSFVIGRTIPQPDITLIHSGGGSNPRLRDMKDWWTFYGETRKERLAIAARIRTLVGLPTPPNLGPIQAGWEERDVVALPLSEQIVARQGEREPDDHYLKAHAAALEVIGKRQRICLCMIVKNEAAVIRRCLDSVAPIITEFCIVDTGSTDGTQDIIIEHEGIHGVLHERPWVDFATNRSEALELARQTGADYSLIIDADDVLEIPAGFQLPRLDLDSYEFTIKLGDITYGRQQLVSNRLPWRYRGVVHEFITCENAGALGRLPLSIRCSNDGARRNDPKTYEKDALALESALREETDPFMRDRYEFYLAQSWRDAGQPEKAIEHYLLRADMGGFPEEVYISLLEAARCMNNAGRPDDEVIATFRRAIAQGQRRAEADHDLAFWFRQHGRYDEGYRTAAAALHKQQPFDAMFARPEVYQYQLLDELSVSAYHSGRYAECKNACLKLLDVQNLPPDVRRRIVDNLAWADRQLENTLKPQAA